VIGFINGLPLVFIELKRYDQHVDKAFKKKLQRLPGHDPPTVPLECPDRPVQRRRCQGRLPDLDRGAFLPLEAACGGRSGTEEGPAAAPILLRGLLNRETLLDVVENFILYDRTEGRSRKSWPGITNTWASTGDRQAVVGKVQGSNEVAAGKLGVFWIPRDRASLIP